MREQQIDPNLLEQTRREIGKLVTEIENLANQDIPEPEFHAEYLRRICAALAAQGAALWLKTPNGNLQLQHQINLQALGIHSDESIRQAHDELLRDVLTRSKPTVVPPHSGPGSQVDDAADRNPTNSILVIAPIVMEGGAIGVLEVFQSAERRASAQQGYVHFLSRIAGELTKYIKNRQLRRIRGKEELWNQLESFIRGVHGGLNPKQVSYLIANDGRKLIQCERLSVALRRGRRARIEAISGQDVVERRSNLVQRMARLATAVLKHGENLLYTGTFEAHWPGDLASALKSYLEESGSRLVAVVPMRDTREFGVAGKAQAALVVEMIEDQASPDDMGARVEVVARHGASALFNALEYHRIPLLPVLKLVGRSTETISARTLPKVIAIVALVAAVVASMIFIPWPLRLEGRGELVPKTRQTVFAPVTGLVKTVKVDHGDLTEQGSLLAQMSSPELETQLLELQGDLKGAEQALRGLEAERQQKGAFDTELGGKISNQKLMIEGLQRQIDLVKAHMRTLDVISPIRGKVMDFKPKETLTLRPVQQGDVLLEIADPEGDWILEIEFPEKVVPHIAKARAASNGADLPVTYVLSAAPEFTYQGTLVELATQARAVEQQNVIEAKIALEGDVPKLVKGVEVRAKVDCGPHPLGYVLFHELIDFAREYIFF